MRFTELELTKTYNTGNYSSIKIGGVWCLQEGDDIAVSVRLASIQCDRMFEEAMQASKEEAEKVKKEAEKVKKESEKVKKEAEENVGKQAPKQPIPQPISVDDSRFAYCLKRLHEGVSLEEMTSKVSFDAVALDRLVQEERKINQKQPK